MKKIFSILTISAIALSLCSCTLAQNNGKSEKTADSKTKLVEGYKDIHGVSTDGTAVKLSDYLGKGNYVLVDFWASWCGPCRNETPFIIKVYNEYKDKGLTVVGIAVSDKKNDTLKAIKELGIPYNQILEADTSDVQAYGVRAIPSIFLFAPDGKVIQHGMREEGIAESVKKVIK